MAKDDQQEAFERLLSSTLSRTIDFVKFAETKNAALLTFCSIWILSSVNLLFGNSQISSFYWKIAFGIALPLFTIAALISILSFLPRTNLANLHKDPTQDKSLLFFGDIASFSSSAYRDRVRQRYMPPEKFSATQSYLDDLSIQVNVNSSIALYKFRLFHASAVVVIIALIVLAIPSIENIYDIIFNISSAIKPKT